MAALLFLISRKWAGHEANNYRNMPADFKGETHHHAGQDGYIRRSEDKHSLGTVPNDPTNLQCFVILSARASLTYHSFTDHS